MALHKHGKANRAGKSGVTVDNVRGIRPTGDNSTPSGGGKVLKTSNLSGQTNKVTGKSFVLGSTSKPAIFGITPEEIKKARLK